MRRIFLLLSPAVCLAEGAGIDLRTSSLPIAVVHRPYTPPPLTAIGGGRCVPNVIGFRVTAGSLPEGISLSAAGLLSGMPISEGVYSFSVRAQNECVSFTRPMVLRVEGPPLLEVSPSRIEFRYQTGGTLPEPQTIRVRASSPGLAYAVDVEGAPWLELRPLRGRTPPEGSAMQHDVVEVAADPGKLQPGEYTVRLRAEAWQAGNAPTVLVTLRVTGRRWE